MKFKLFNVMATVKTETLAISIINYTNPSTIFMSVPQYYVDYNSLSVQEKLGCNFQFTVSISCKI